jgi:hypothetical protein
VTAYGSELAVARERNGEAVRGDRLLAKRARAGMVVSCGGYGRSCLLFQKPRCAEGEAGA